MSRQVPIGPDNLICPLHKKSMDKVCHKCPWWACLRGNNPQTGEPIDRWDCAIAHMPVLQVETSQQVRQCTATTESFRNEVVKRSESTRYIDNQPTLFPMLEASQ